LTTEADFSDKSDFIRFYGIGNGVPVLQNGVPANFYRTRYTNYSVTIGVVRDFWKRSELSGGVHYENNSTVQDVETILETVNLGFPGLQDANLLEGYLSLDLDFRDRSSFPNKGMRLFMEHRSGVNTVDDDQPYFIAKASLEQHSTFKVLSPWTLSFKAAGSTSTGEEAIPFYRMVYLGQRTGLRGYQSNRFTGQSTAVLSSELRVQLIESKTTFVPLKFGVKAFFDAGRVFSNFDVTQQIFTGYGAGIYIVPYSQRFALNISYGLSQEESGLLLLSIGTSFQ